MALLGEKSKGWGLPLCLLKLDIVKAFDGVRIPDIAENHRLLGSSAGGPALEPTAERLVRLMLENKLLLEDVNVQGLTDAGFLPAP